LHIALNAARQQLAQTATNELRDSAAFSVGAKGDNTAPFISACCHFRRGRHFSTIRIGVRLTWAPKVGRTAFRYIGSKRGKQPYSDIQTDDSGLRERLNCRSVVACYENCRTRCRGGAHSSSEPHEKRWPGTPLTSSSCTSRRRPFPRRMVTCAWPSGRYSTLPAEVLPRIAGSVAPDRLPRPRTLSGVDGVDGVDGACILRTPLTPPAPRWPNTTGCQSHPVNAHPSCRQFPSTKEGSLAATLWLVSAKSGQLAG